MSKTIFYKDHRFVLACAFALFAAVNAYALRNAPVLGGDTHHYVDAVNQFLEEGSITGRNQNYSGYVLFLSLCKAISPSGISYFALSVVFQTLFSCAALFCLHAVGVRIFSQTTGLLSALCFSVNYYAIFWNQYVLTDSLFISFVIISCYAAVKASTNRWFLLLALPSVAFTAMLRPNGLVFLPVFFVYLVSSLKPKVQAVLYICVAVAVALAGAFIMTEFQKATDRIQTLDQIERGTIIWNLKRIDMPKLEDKSGNIIQPKPNRTSFAISKGRPITRSRGTLLRPAVGRIVGRYGRPSRTGLRRRDRTVLR